ncbi:MAG: type II toxin-antitoxin system RelE/ParE family toxin [Spirochaetia bacterium]|nr:type II toxin-antitoxin system RelE/ParE family toxin [Spirochaetia bacterium]
MRIVYTESALRELRKLDRTAREKIKECMDRVAGLPDPRMAGKALRGGFAGLWRYRAGDYRIICDITNDAILVTVLHIGHRREIYK